MEKLALVYYISAVRDDLGISARTYTIIEARGAMQIKPRVFFFETQHGDSPVALWKRMFI